jgi:hypothetical protein
VSQISQALFDWNESETDSAIDEIERSLLGTCLIETNLLDQAALLSTEDFRAEVRGHVFDAMRSFPKRLYDSRLVAYELERRGVQHPSGSSSWIHALAQLVDVSSGWPELMPAYVKAIKEASVVRKHNARQAARPLQRRAS